MKTPAAPACSRHWQANNIKIKQNKYDYIINIMARTARVLSALTAVLEKVKIISKQVFPKNNYYKIRFLYFKLWGAGANA